MFFAAKNAGMNIKLCFCEKLEINKKNLSFNFSVPGDHCFCYLDNNYLFKL